MIKNPPAKAGDITAASLIPGLGRSPGEEQPTPVILPGESWTGDPDRLQSIGSKESDITEAT